MDDQILINDPTRTKKPRPSLPIDMHNNETVQAYMEKIGTHLAMAYMALKFLPDHDGAERVNEAGSSILGEEKWEKKLIELNTRSI